jgi:hypothetical protein
VQEKFYYRKIIACRGNALRDLKVSSTPCFCWLHFEVSPLADFPETIKHLARLPSTHIAISGKDAAYLHDQIDDILVEMGSESITTTWHEEPLQETAWDFMNLDFNEDEAASHIIAVFAHDLNRDLALLKDLIDSCRKAID